MDWKNKIWSYLTAIIVLLLISNPEMAGLALFIDAVGLEMFLMLLEIQILVLLTVFFDTKIRPIFNYMKKIYAQYFLQGMLLVKQRDLLLRLPGPAALMYTMVFSVFIDILFKA